MRILRVVILVLSQAFVFYSLFAQQIIKAYSPPSNFDIRPTARDTVEIPSGDSVDPTYRNEKKTALIFGNGTYKKGPLHHAVNDALDMAAVLSAKGFKVIFKQNATREEMRNGLREFSSEINAGGVGLFYYAGHGLQIDGTNYLIPIDADIEMKAEVALYCSIDQFSKSLKHVSGNGIGKAVIGGPDRTIVWNVLGDVDKLVGQYNFEIRALVKARSVEINPGESEKTAAVISRDEAYPKIAESITDFINEAKDFKDAFALFGEKAIESRQALNNLSEAIKQYNRTFEKLNKERLTYENYVAVFWKQDILTLEFRALMDYALGDLHGVNILTLNQKIAEINNIIEGRARRAGEAKKALINDIKEEVVSLDKRLQELERRTNRALYNLSQE